MTNELVSIIVPVYNIEKYLEKCVRSILKQSYPYFELLLVDDGSCDSSAQLCDSFEQEDCRVKAYHKINGGVSSARNYGLSKATGKYICFVDGDDLVDVNYLSDLLSCMDEDTDFVMSKFYYLDGSYKFTPPPSEDIKGNVDVLFSNHDLLLTCYPPYGKIYRLSCIRTFDLRFDEKVRHGEDCLFVFSYLMKVNKVVFSSKVNYYYIRRGGSAVSRIYPFEETYYSYKTIYDLVSQFVFVRNITGKPNKEQLYSMVCTFAHRAINSIYNGTSYSLDERLHLLKKIDFNLLGKYMYVSNAKDFLIRILYRIHSYYLYDKVRCFIR